MFFCMFEATARSLSAMAFSTPWVTLSTQYIRRSTSIMTELMTESPYASTVITAAANGAAMYRTAATIW